MNMKKLYPVQQLLSQNDDENQSNQQKSLQIQSFNIKQTNLNQMKNKKNISQQTKKFKYIRTHTEQNQRIYEDQMKILCFRFNFKCLIILLSLILLLMYALYMVIQEVYHIQHSQRFETVSQKRKAFQQSKHTQQLKALQPNNIVKASNKAQLQNRNTKQSEIQNKIQQTHKKQQTNKLQTNKIQQTKLNQQKAQTQINRQSKLINIQLTNEQINKNDKEILIQKSKIKQSSIFIQNLQANDNQNHQHLNEQDQLQYKHNLIQNRDNKQQQNNKHQTNIHNNNKDQINQVKNNDIQNNSKKKRNMPDDKQKDVKKIIQKIINIPQQASNMPPPKAKASISRQLAMQAHRFQQMLNLPLNQKQSLISQKQGLISQQYQYYQKKYQISKYPQLPICVVIPTYNNVANWRYKQNLKSILQQNYTNYHIVLIDDMSQDHTGQKAQQYLNELSIPQHKVKIIINQQRKTAMVNLRYAAIYQCKPQELFIIVDGDDLLVGRQVFKLFSAVMQKQQLWVMYTNFITPRGSIGYSRQYSPLNRVRNNYRRAGFVMSHLRAYYTKLFRMINQQDLKDASGQYYHAANDVAIGIPILQMSHLKVAYIPQITYYYNLNTGLNNHKVRLRQQKKNDKQIRKKTRYSPLKDLFTAKEDSQNKYETTQNTFTNANQARLEIKKINDNIRNSIEEKMIIIRNQKRQQLLKKQQQENQVDNMQQLNQHPNIQLADQTKDIQQINQPLNPHLVQQTKNNQQIKQNNDDENTPQQVNNKNKQEKDKAKLPKTMLKLQLQLHPKADPTRK